MTTTDPTVSDTTAAPGVDLGKDPAPEGSAATGVGAGASPPVTHRPPPARLIPPPPHARRTRRLVRMAVWGAAGLDRINRLLLVLLGLVVAAAGALGLLLFNGEIHNTGPATIYKNLVSDARGNVDASAAVATAICLVVAVLFAWWALAQLRPVGDGERVGNIRLARSPLGKTDLAANTLAKAASSEIGSRPGVSSARVRIRAAKPIPRLLASVELALDADVDAVLAQVDEGLDHVLEALEAPREDAEIELRLRFARGGRVSAPRVGRVD